MKKIIYALRYTSAILIFLFPGAPSPAQAGMLQGWVKDEKGDPLCGASVTIKESKTGTATDRMGHFKLKLAPGDYIILISFIDHAVVQERISIRTRETSERNFITAKVYKECNEVTVLCPLLKRAPVNINIFTRNYSVNNDTTGKSSFEIEKPKSKGDSSAIKFGSIFPGSVNDPDPRKKNFRIPARS